MLLKQFLHVPLLLCVAVGCTNVVASATSTTSSSSKNAEEARWLVSEARWGVVTTIQQPGSDDVRPLAGVVPMADDGGHIYLYLMQQQEKHDEEQQHPLAAQESRSVAITFSEASLPPYSNFAEGACGDKGQVDSEDPRCAKLTLTGTVAPCDSEDVTKGKEALFERHPQMKDWPVDHQFVVYEIVIDQEGWMISNFGGGGTFSADAYYQAAPRHHPAYDDESTRSAAPGVASALLEESSLSPVPDWKQKVERARWIVANSLVTTGKCLRSRHDSSTNMHQLKSMLQFPQSLQNWAYHLEIFDLLSMVLHLQQVRACLSFTCPHPIQLPLTFSPIHAFLSLLRKP